MYRVGPKMTIITQGANGARLYDGERFIHFTAPIVPVVDSTGAGDVFAAVFLVRYLECSEVITAGRFAVAAAALSMRGFAASALPSGLEIEQLMERHFLDPGTVTIRKQDPCRE
jgi:ribokinase